MRLKSNALWLVLMLAFPLLAGCQAAQTAEAAQPTQSTEATQPAQTTEIAQTAAPRGPFAGTWTTNIGLLILQQDGDKVTGLLDGYGNWHKANLSGTVQGNTLTFKFEGTDLLGIDGIVLEPGENAFHSTDATVAFCGTKSDVLPDGCGFSGKWNFNAPDTFPSGSYAQLQQQADMATGQVFDKDGATLMDVKARVSWGKGWSADSPNFTASMASHEQGFIVGVSGKNQCALREGVTSAYLMYFTCELP